MSEDMSVAESAESTESSVEESGSLLNPGATTEEAEQPQEDGSVPHLVAEDQQHESDDEIDWGDRPDWIPEQFWDQKEGPLVEKMGKSYIELREKMSAGKHKAPKDGKYDLSTLVDHGVADDDPLLNDFKGFATENGLSQDQFDQITQMHLQHMNELLDQQETSREAELAKLGPRGEKIISGLNQWLSKLGNAGALSYEEVDALASAMDRADRVKALQKIRESYGERSIPDTSVQEGTGYSKDELMSMMNDPRYGNDMAFTNDVQNKWYKLHGEG